MSKKCLRCGNSFLWHRKVKLQDAEICFDCFKELGFDKSDLLTAAIYPYEAIKDGKTAYYANKRKKALRDEAVASAKITVTGAGRERDLVCTEEERMVFEELELICADLALPEPLRLTRVSDNYVSAKIGEWDLARFKYIARAKWIVLPIVESGSQKHPIESPGDVASFADQLKASVEHIKKYS